MSMIRIAKRYGLATVLLAQLGFGQAAQAEEFVCHVTLSNGAKDLVFVVTDTRMDASRMATSAERQDAAGKPLTVNYVQECIQRFSEKFADPGAAKLLETKPL